MSTIELSKEYSNTQKLQPWSKKCVYFFRVQHNILPALLTRLQKTSSRQFQDIFNTSSRRLAKTSSRHLEDVFEMGPANIRLDEDFLKTSFVFVFRRRLQDILIKANIFTLLISLQKTSSRRFQDILQTRLQNVSKTSCKNVFKTSSRHLTKTFSRRLQNVFKKPCKNIFKTSSRPLQDVLKTSSGRLAKMSLRPVLDVSSS